MPYVSRHRSLTFLLPLSPMRSRDPPARPLPRRFTKRRRSPSATTVRTMSQPTTTNHLDRQRYSSRRPTSASEVQSRGTLWGTAEGGEASTAGHPCRSGAGQECWPVFLLVRDLVAGAPMRGRGQGSGVARPRSGRRALTAIPFGASCGVVAGRCSSCRGVLGSDGRGSHQGRRFRWEQAMVPLGHPFATPSPGSGAGSHDGVRAVAGTRSVGVNQNARPRRERGS